MAPAHINIAVRVINPGLAALDADRCGRPHSAAARGALRTRPSARALPMGRARARARQRPAATSRVVDTDSMQLLC